MSYSYVTADGAKFKQGRLHIYSLHDIALHILFHCIEIMLNYICSSELKYVKLVWTVTGEKLFISIGVGRVY